MQCYLVLIPPDSTLIDIKISELMPVDGEDGWSELIRFQRLLAFSAGQCISSNGKKLEVRFAT